MATGELMIVDLPQLNIKRGDIIIYCSDRKYHNLRTKEIIDDNCIIARNSIRVIDFSYDELRKGYRIIKTSKH